MTWPCPAGLLPASPGTDLWHTSGSGTSLLWANVPDAPPTAAPGYLSVLALLRRMNGEAPELQNPEPDMSALLISFQNSFHALTSNFTEIQKASPGSTHKQIRSSLQREIWDLWVGGSDLEFSLGGLQVLAMLGVARWNVYLAFCPRCWKQRGESEKNR